MQSVSKGFSSFSKGLSNVLPGGFERQQIRIGKQNDMAREAKRAAIGWDNLDIEQQKAWARKPENELWTILTTEEEAEWKYKAGLGSDPNNRGMQVVGLKDSGYMRGGKRTRTRSKSRSKSRSRPKSRSWSKSRSKSRKKR
jgi:hypothetical protein